MSTTAALRDDVFVIAVHAEPQLQQHVISAIQERLPLNHVRWKSNTLKRELHSPILAAVVRPFTSKDVMPPSSTHTFHRQPILHICAVTCQDVAEYRQKRYVEISQWHEQVHAMPHTGWFIVHVTPTPIKTKSMRLSLREDVFGRLKSDFGGRAATDVCLQLPSKEASIQRELHDNVWNTFISRLRASLVTHIEYRLRWLRDRAALHTLPLSSPSTTTTTTTTTTTSKSSTTKRAFRSQATAPTGDRDGEDDDFVALFLAQDDLALCYQAAGLVAEAELIYTGVLRRVREYARRQAPSLPLSCPSTPREQREGRQVDAHAALCAVGSMLSPCDTTDGDSNQDHDPASATDTKKRGNDDDDHASSTSRSKEGSSNSTPTPPGASRVEGFAFSAPSLARARQRLRDGACSVIDLDTYATARLARVLRSQREDDAAAGVVLECITHLSSWVDHWPRVSESRRARTWRCVLALDALRFLQSTAPKQSAPPELGATYGLLLDLTMRFFLRLGVHTHQHLPPRRPLLSTAAHTITDITGWRPSDAALSQTPAATNNRAQDLAALLDATDVAASPVPDPDNADGSAAWATGNRSVRASGLFSVQMTPLKNTSLLTPQAPAAGTGNEPDEQQQRGEDEMGCADTDGDASGRNNGGTPQSFTFPPLRSGRVLQRAGAADAIKEEEERENNDDNDDNADVVEEWKQQQQQQRQQQQQQRQQQPGGEAEQEEGQREARTGDNDDNLVCSHHEPDDGSEAMQRLFTPTTTAAAVVVAPSTRNGAGRKDRPMPHIEDEDDAYADSHGGGSPEQGEDDKNSNVSSRGSSRAGNDGSRARGVDGDDEAGADKGEQDDDDDYDDDDYDGDVSETGAVCSGGEEDEHAAAMAVGRVEATHTRAASSDLNVTIPLTDTGEEAPAPDIEGVRLSHGTLPPNITAPEDAAAEETAETVANTSATSSNVAVYVSPTDSPMKAMAARNTQDKNRQPLQFQLQSRTSRSILQSCADRRWYFNFVAQLGHECMTHFQMRMRRRLALTAMLRLAAFHFANNHILEAEALYAHASRQTHADRWDPLQLDALEGLCACYALRRQWSRLASCCLRVLAAAASIDGHAASAWTQQRRDIATAYAGLLQSLGEHCTTLHPLSPAQLLRVKNASITVEPMSEPQLPPGADRLPLSAGRPLAVSLHIASNASVPLSADAVELCFAKIVKPPTSQPGGVVSGARRRSSARLRRRHSACAEDLVLSTKMNGRSSPVTFGGGGRAQTVVVRGICRQGTFDAAAVRLHRGHATLVLPLEATAAGLRLNISPAPDDVTVTFGTDSCSQHHHHHQQQQQQQQQQQLTFISGCRQRHTLTLHPGSLGVEQLTALVMLPSHAAAAATALTLISPDNDGSGVSVEHMCLNVSQPRREPVQLRLASFSEPMPNPPICVDCATTRMHGGQTTNERQQQLQLMGQQPSSAEDSHDLEVQLSYTQLISNDAKQSVRKIPVRCCDLASVTGNAWVDKQTIMFRIVLADFAAPCTVRNPTLDLHGTTEGIVYSCHPLMPVAVALSAHAAGDKLAFQWAVCIRQEDDSKQWDAGEVLARFETHGNVSFSVEPLQTAHVQESSRVSFENRHTLTRRLCLTHPLAAVEVSWQQAPQQHQQHQQPERWVAGEWTTMQGSVQLLPLVHNMRAHGTCNLKTLISSNEHWLVSASPTLDVEVHGDMTSEVAVTLLPLRDDYAPHPLLTAQPGGPDARDMPLVINRSQ